MKLMFGEDCNFSETYHINVLKINSLLQVIEIKVQY